MNGSNMSEISTQLMIPNGGNSSKLQDIYQDQIKLLEHITSYLWIIFSPIIYIFGLLGNLSILAVLTKLAFWKKPIYILIAVLAFSDVTVLSVGLSRYWTREVFGADIRSLTDVGCKINVFVIYTFMQFSSMLLVCITLERFLKTRFTLKYHLIVSTKRTVILIVFVFVFLSGLNCFWFETQGLVNFEGDLSCDATTETYFWVEEFIYTYMDLFVLSVLPFFAMVAMNISIMRVLNESKKLRSISVSDKSTRKELGKFSQVLARMILFTSTYFLITTIPVSIYFITDSYMAPKADDITTARLDVVWAVTYLFLYTNYAVNFFVYMVTNKLFYRTFWSLLGCCSKNE